MVTVYTIIVIVEFWQIFMNDEVLITYHGKGFLVNKNCLYICKRYRDCLEQQDQINLSDSYSIEAFSLFISFLKNPTICIPEKYRDEVKLIASLWGCPIICEWIDRIQPIIYDSFIIINETLVPINIGVMLNKSELYRQSFYSINDVFTIQRAYDIEVFRHYIDILHKKSEISRDDDIKSLIAINDDFQSSLFELKMEKEVFEMVGTMDDPIMDISDEFIKDNIVPNISDLIRFPSFFGLSLSILIRVFQFVKDTLPSDIIRLICQNLLEKHGTSSLVLFHYIGISNQQIMDKILNQSKFYCNASVQFDEFSRIIHSIKEPGNNFEGIFSFLFSLGSNIIDYVSVKASSKYRDDLDPLSILKGEISQFATQAGQNQWISISLLKHSLHCTGYAIKTNPGKKGYYHLKNWNFLASVDEINWKCIDHQNNNHSLNGPNNEEFFEILHTGMPYKHFMIQLPNSNGTWFQNEDILQFRRIELFGDLI